MGKLVQVKISVAEVRLPPLNLPFLAGETTTLTDREYAGLSTATRAAIVVIQSGLADPVRSAIGTFPSSASDAYKLAKQYTDDAILALSTLGNDPPAQMATHTEVQQGDANTLTSAKAYTDQQGSVESTMRTAGDAATLASAKTYTDTSVSGLNTRFDASGSATAAQSAAEAYTDTSISSEVTRATTADSTTLATAESYTDTSVGNESAARVSGDASTLASAKTYTDTSVSNEASARTTGDSSTLASAKSYTDSVTSGGLANSVQYVAQTLTAAQRGQAQQNLGLVATPEQFGALGDGTTDDTAAFQSAVNSLSTSGGGVLLCLAKHYVIGGLILNSGVVMTDGSIGRMSAGKYVTLITPPSGFTGWIIDTPSSATDSIAVQGFFINGGVSGSSSPDTGGLRFQNVSWGRISNLGVGATSLGCVNIVAPSVACLIENCTLQNFWNWRPTLTQDEGVLTVGGTDHVVRGNQCNGGDNLHVYDAVNFYRCGLLLAAWTSWVFEGNGEYSDCGIKVTGKLNKLTSARADVNAGHGIMIEYFGNILSDITVISNSCASSGSYDGIYLTGQAYNTTIDGVTSGDFVGVKHRYVVNDQVLGTTPAAALALPIIENVQAIDNSYAVDLINHLVPYRSMLPPGAGYSIARPASRYCHGSTWYDTQLLKPVFSDGAHWRDASGNISGNILTPALSSMIGSFVNGNSASGWASNAGTTLSLVDGWAAYSRPKALQVTNTGAVNGCAAFVAYTGNVVAGTAYTFVAYTKALTVAASVSASITFYDSNNNPIGSAVVGTAANNSTTAITLYTMSATAPTGAVGAAIVVSFNRTGMAQGEAHTLSKVALVTGTVTDYVHP